jgi:integrase
VTVYIPKGGTRYVFDFEHDGKRHWGPTGMSRRRDAEEFERNYRVGLERHAGDLTLRAKDTPRMQDWAEVYYQHKRDSGKMKRPDLLAREIRVVLEFCGAEPTKKSQPMATSTRKPPPRRAVPVAPPYHDLRLGDFIERPEWILDFERWLKARGTGGSARNHYRSVMSGMFRIAMLPTYRRMTGVRQNPFAGIERDAQPRRRVTLTVEELRAWVTHASPHVRTALAIGGLAPALRLGSILGLRWGQHFDADFKFITITDHKTSQERPEPVVIPIAAQLREILILAHAGWLKQKAQNPKVTAHVVQYRGRGVKTIKKGLRDAARRAKIAYGVKVGGATFHTLRHTMATMLAEMGVSESHRKALLDHHDIATTQIYTHFRPMHLIAPLEQLSADVPLGDVIRANPKLPRRGKNRGACIMGKTVGVENAPDALSEGESVSRATRARRAKR